ncbi:MAG TPA: glycosyltransferase [Candidatus Limnocylindrales bacterium]
MQAAIVHDYFVQDGGAERVAIELANLLPTARIFTTFFDAARFGDRIDPARVHCWALNEHFDEDRFRSLLPLYPAYFSALDLREFDLVVSSSSAFAKAVRTSRRHVHVAYIHAPMRFAWQFRDYERGSSLGTTARFAGSLLSAPLRTWDRRTAQRPTHLVANSAAVRDRIRSWWGRDADVIYPPVDTHEIGLSTVDDGYLLVVARLLAYRRVDLAVDAANATGRRLVIVGDGPERAALEKRAGPSVTFEGYVQRARLVDLLRRCSAYLVPGEEDFGIAPVEAMAAGKPVVAINRGGTAETVVDGVSGVLFEEQTEQALVAALDKLSNTRLDPAAIRRRAQRFDRGAFIDDFANLLARLDVDPALVARG